MPGLYSFIANLLDLYVILVIAWVVLGWLQAFNVLPYSRLLHSIMAFLYAITEPGLRIFRRLIPSIGNIDLSPLLLILAIQLIKALLFDLFIRL